MQRGVLPCPLLPLILYFPALKAPKAASDAIAFGTSRGIEGTCFNDVIDPATGDLPADVTALMNCP